MRPCVDARVLDNLAERDLGESGRSARRQREQIHGSRRERMERGRPIELDELGIKRDERRKNRRSGMIARMRIGERRDFVEHFGFSRVISVAVATNTSATTMARSAAMTSRVVGVSGVTRD